MAWQPIVPLLGKFFAALGAMVGFGALIAIHEFGHFIFCKIFGVKTPTFSIGMGPVIFKRRFWDTDFSLSLLPLGGYVEMAGSHEPGQGEQLQAHDRSETSFQSKPYWQKMCIMFGGIFFNLATAFIIYFGLFWHGMPQQTTKSMTISSFVEKHTPAENGGLKVGDKIVGLGGKKFSEEKTTIDAILKNLQGHPSKAMNFTIIRDKFEKSLYVTLGQKESANGPIGSLGAAFELEAGETIYESYSLAESLTHTIATMKAQIIGISSFIKRAFVQRDLSSAGGPLMIASQSFKMASSGIKLLLMFLAYVSINLALLNVLPLGALDGGQILFSTIEFVIRRELPDMFRIAVNAISIFLFALLFFFLTYKDIMRIWLGS